MGSLNRLIFTFTAVILFGSSVMGQLIIDNSYGSATVNAYVQKLAGPGITIINATMNCQVDSQIAAFDGVNTNLGIDSGIMITSGGVLVVADTNQFTSGAGFDVAGGNDVDLDLASNSTTNDACIIEFDIIPSGDSIFFNYVFGSDEYHNFVCSGFNDVFGFFLSGPGITGPYSSPPAFPGGAINIALIPGTTTPVAINNVNNGTDFATFPCSGDPCTVPVTAAACPCNNAFFVDNQCLPAIQQTVNYDGFTTVLQAKAQVIPCDTFHMKLGVADAVDGILDSGVFIEAGSFTSNDIDLIATTTSSLFDFAVEGCLPGIIEFKRLKGFTDSLVIKFTIAGSATNGVDYNFIVDSVILYPGDSNAYIIINPIVDAIADDNEEVKIYLIENCHNTAYDSVILPIRENFQTDIVPPDTAICQGVPLPLNTINDTILDMVWTPNYNLTCNTCDTPVASPLVDTTYIVHATFIPGCEFYDTINVTVKDIVVDAGPDQFLCFGSGTPIPLMTNITGADTIRWSPSTGLSDTTVAVPTALPSVTTTYYVNAWDTVGCMFTDSVTVNVDSMLTIDAGPDDTICLGDTMQIMAVGSGNVTWNPAAGLSDSTVLQPFAFPQVTTTYRAIVNSAWCPSDTDLIVIYVDSMPTLNLMTDDTSICNGDMAQFQAAATTYQNVAWTPSATVNIPNNLNTSANPDTTTTYTLTVTWGICEASDTVMVSVFNAEAGNDTERVCLGDSIQLGTVTQGVTYTWSPGQWLDNDNIQNPKASPPTTTIFSVEITDTNNCVDQDSIFLYVDSVPDANAGTDIAICIGESTQLSGSGGAFYAWSPSDFLSDTTITNPTLTPDTTTIYTLIVSNPYCLPDTDNVTVTVNPLPTIISSGDDTICAGDTTQITVSGGTSYDWNNPAVISDTTIPNPLVYPPLTMTYEVIVTDANGCVELEQITIVVNDLPDSPEMFDRTMCSGIPIVIGPDNPLPGYSYAWTPATGLNNADTSNPEVFHTADSNSVVWNYFLAITDPNGCTVFDTIDITVSPTPWIDAGPDVVMADGATVQLNATGSVTFDIYTWTPTAGLDLPGSPTPSASPDTTTLYFVTGESDCGDPTDSVLVEIIPDPSIIVPLIFTPNGDGLNDFIFAKGRGEIAVSSFRIFNRWGQQVFFTNDPNIGWDGKYKGRNQPIETYVYFATITGLSGTEQLIKGSFTLMR